MARLDTDYGNTAASEALAFDRKVLSEALKRIYRKEFDIDIDIDSGIFNETLRAFDEAADKGFELSEFDVDEAFRDAVRHNNAVLSAFRTHTLQREIADLMLDPDGNLRTYADFKEAAAPVLGKSIDRHLQTEYSTAVLRAQQAANWKQYEAEADILPNLRWVPSTSAHPGEDHRQFWGTVLPVRHPFWDSHRPGDRWNCKCDLEATDDKATAAPSGFGSSDAPHAGLENNPAKDAALISDRSPYFPSSCGACPFRPKGIKNALIGIILNREKDCMNCPYANGCMDKATERKLIKDKTATVEAIKLQKKAMPAHNGLSVDSKRFDTGKMTALRRSLDDIYEHSIEVGDIRQWLRTFKIDNLKAMKYRGWANNRPYPENHPKFDPENPSKSKHDNDTLWFNYYTITINKQAYWVNVKMHKHFGEVVYTIEKEKPTDLIKGHKKR